MLERALQAPIADDLREKMVLLAGPRQVGKTTLARGILSRSEAGLYLSWDRREDRREIRAARWPGGRALVVLDELHKMRGWKTWLWSLSRNPPVAGRAAAARLLRCFALVVAALRLRARASHPGRRRSAGLGPGLWIGS